MNQDPFQLALNYWRANSVTLLPAATIAEIASAFERLNCPLSADVRRLYSTTGGFANYESHSFWAFWPLDRLVEENKDRKPGDVWFADWLISSHLYLIRYIDAEVSAVYIDYYGTEITPRQIAPSVADFLRKYVEEPERVEVWSLED